MQAPKPVDPEALVRAGIEPPIDALWPVLGNPDRFVRFAAR